MMHWELFGDLPPEEIRRVLAMARRRTFSRGEVVFHEGDPADSLHLIAKVSGRLKEMALRNLPARQPRK